MIYILLILNLFGKVLRFILRPIILWFNYDQIEGKFTSIVGFVSATGFICMFFEKEPCLRFVFGFSGGILFYIGYLLKKKLLGNI